MKPCTGIIIKLQQPLASGEETPFWLAYNEDRTKCFFLAADLIPLNVVRDMNNDPKGYFEAQVRGADVLIGRRVEDQPW